MNRIELDPKEVDPEWLEDVPWENRSGPYRALGHRFAVRTNNSVLGAHLEKVFRPLTDAGPWTAQYSAFDDGPGCEPRFSLYVGCHRAFAASDPPLFAKLLTWHVNQEAVRLTPTHLLIHASAAEYAGRALLFPAPTESGKTTLVAGLVLAGLRYLTDEAAAIDPVSLQIDPYPRSLSIEPESWPVLPSLEPPATPSRERFGCSRWEVDPNLIRPDAVAPPSVPAFVVVPCFAPGLATDLTPLSRADALALLLASCFNLPVHGRQGFATAAAVVRQSSCHRLIMGDLDEAVLCVLDLLDFGH